ncbi:MAG: hypothetical protein A2Z04_09865 [Chloroflexi bacterium RBG_16_57_9]|nr:MAG: hypothetical protein A2Z04_09865 [Chloroflexi bacterium RBG_16_57_9]
MAFLVQDYHDLVRLLADHPEWRAELRQMVLSDELLALPEVVRELAEAQQRTETRVEELASDIRALTSDIRALTSDVRELTANVRDLAGAQRQMQDRPGSVIGDLLELRYRQHAAGYFGRWVRKARAVDPVDFEDTLEATLEHEDVLDVLRLDLLIGGRWRALPEAPEIWLAVEVASMLDEGDVARAWRRASLLRRAGFRVVPVVAGEKITPDAQASARAQNVGVVQDGQGTFTEDGLAAWLA